jgi:hypothetical protein
LGVKKLLAAVASVGLVVTPMAASAQSYGHVHGGWGGREAQQRQYDGGSAYRGYSRDVRGSYGRDGHRDDHGANIAGAAIIAGVAGLLLGSVLSSQQSSGYSQPYAQPYEDSSSGYAPSYNYQPGW